MFYDELRGFKLLAEAICGGFHLHTGSEMDHGGVVGEASDGAGKSVVLSIFIINNLCIWKSGSSLIGCLITQVASGCLL